MPYLIIKKMTDPVTGKINFTVLKRWVKSNYGNKRQKES